MKFIGQILLWVLLVAGVTSSATAAYFSPPVRSPSISVAFNSLYGYTPGQYHTGVDYRGNGNTDVLATNDGVIKVVQVNGAMDHGMGNCVIMEHRLSGGDSVFSLYAHLTAVNPDIQAGVTVAKRKPLGKMGGTGYGYKRWATHLHFEIKRIAVLGCPYNASGYYGYTPKSASNYGYLNPYDYIDKVCTQEILRLGIEKIVQETQTKRGGDPKYFRVQSGYGSDSVMCWSYAMGNIRENWMAWNSGLPAGCYEIQVFIPGNFATTRNAVYHLMYRSGSSWTDLAIKAVNQYVYYNVWLILGRFDFPGEPSVLFGDDTGEDFSLRRMIGYDAVKFVEIIR